MGALAIRIALPMLQNQKHAFVRCLSAAAIAVVALLPLAAAPDAPRVLLISVDGLKPSSYTDPAFAARTPNLRRLAQEGVWADGVVGVTPTVTYPSHTTLITGVEPARHGIYDNRILDPENRSNGAGTGTRAPSRCRRCRARCGAAA